MAFCSKCGAQLADDAAFCMQCGTPANNQTQNTTQNTAQQAPQSQQYAAPVQPLSPEADIKENKAMAVLSYIGILFLIPLFAAKNSPYARFHVRQGATLFALSLLYTIAQWIIISILNAALPRVYYFFYSAPNPIVSVVSAILGICALVFLVLMIIGIVNAAQGKYKELPVIGKWNFVSRFIK